jgi:hypothetical protein
VTVTVGTGSGLTAQTDGAGRYDLFGVAGTIELHVTTDGRLASLERLAVSSHASLDVVLIPPPPPGMSFDGLYTLEIDAGTCTGGFPEAGKHRVYSAQIQQIDQMLRVSLSDADIWKGSGQFTGTINQSGEIKFTIRPAWWWDYEAFDLIENIGNGLTVIVQGSIVATRIAGGIIGRPNPDTNAADALGIRLNQSFGGACAIQRFQMVPK